MSAGYVYLLVNSSMPGLIKVGRTERPVVERVAELSAPTGVPTPFELVFEVFVDDCEGAERRLHEHLSQRGYRVSTDREFFQAPIRDVISLMCSLPEAAIPISRKQSEEVHQPTPVPLLHDPLFEKAARFCENKSKVFTADLMRELQNRILTYNRPDR